VTPLIETEDGIGVIPPPFLESLEAESPTGFDLSFKSLAVTRESLGVVAIGIIVGVGGAFALSSLVVSLLFELKPLDPLSMFAAVAVLIVAAFPAAFIPALRAVRIDPARLLREE
jgi:predicted lysophospholipase L1 biosynthesis ABC-type transport system permease subunit